MYENILLYRIWYVNKICKIIYLQSGLKTEVLLSMYNFFNTT